MLPKTGDAVRDANSRAVAFEFTPEVRERWSSASAEIIDAVEKATSGPVEGLALLHFVMKSLAECYGIEFHDSMLLGDEDLKRGG